MMEAMRPIVRLGSAHWALTLTMATAAGGCQDYRFERICAQQIVEEQQTFAAARPRPADILFIVDNSGSMREEQENLASNFDLFINQIAGQGDYRIAVVSTDQTNAIETSGLAEFTFSDEAPYFTRVQPIGRAACMSTDIEQGCFRGANPATRVIDSNLLTPEQQISSFQSNVRVGTCGSGTERGLRAMQDALSKTDGGQCNASFLREDANLVLVFVSDENDTDDTPIEDYVDFLGTIKDYSQIRAAAIVGYADGDARDCRTGAEGAATAACGSICSTPPPLGSQTRCSGDNNCVLGEVCVFVGPDNDDRECRPPIWTLWDDDECSNCSTFLTDDCCLADGGSRYQTFLESLETRIAAAAPGITVTGCQPTTGARPACLIDSVCQASFGETLIRIARDLVSVDEYTLDPPAEHPPGVRARVIGGRFGEDGVDLVPPQSDGGAADFTVDELDGKGVGLRILNPDRVPLQGEQVQIFYVSDVEQGENQPPGICPDGGT